MPRRQRDLDPSGGPVVDLARDLRALRAAAGDPKFATMARRTGRSKTALAEAAGGRRLPRRETVEDFARACDADPEAWGERWASARAALDAGPPDDTDPTNADGETVSTQTVDNQTADADGPTADDDAGDGERGDHPRTDLPTPPTGDTPPRPDGGRTAEPRSGPRSGPPSEPAVRRRRLTLAGVVAVVLVAAAAGFGLGRTTAEPAPELVPLLRAVEIQNKVALGADRLVEDTSPVYLSTLPLAYCADPARSCKVPGTEMGSGAAVVANCTTTGQQMWNYDLKETAGAGNPGRTASDLWYRVSFPDGRTGYVSEVYMKASSRGGLDLPRCGVGAADAPPAPR